MEPHFSLSYSEYSVIAELTEHLKKSEGVSCYIPVSRQEKGIDFILRNSKSGKQLSFQVKSSKPHSHSNLSETWDTFFFKNFIESYKAGIRVDYYMIFGVYPLYQKQTGISSKTEHWKTMILCFNNREMGRILESIKTRKGKRDHFFYITRYASHQFFITRGLPKELNITKHLLEKKIPELRKRIS